MDIYRTNCPNCGEAGTLSIDERLVANEIGTFSLSGAQIKVTARGRPVLTCSSCPFALVGNYDEDGKHVTFRPVRRPD